MTAERYLSPTDHPREPNITDLSGPAWTGCAILVLVLACALLAAGVILLLVVPA